MTKIKYIRYSLLILVIFISVYSFWGMLNIGILSDTFGDAFTAVNSGFADKITNKLQFIDVNRYRPILYITLQGITNLNHVLGIPFDNFILYKIVSIVLYLYFALLSGYVVFQLTGDLLKSVLSEVIVLMFPNNLHNLFWSAAYFELLCGVFYLFAMLHTVYYIQSGKNKNIIYSNMMFAFSLLTKEISVVFPVVVVLISFLYFGKEKIISAKRIFISQFTVLILYFVVKLFLNNKISVISTANLSGDFFPTSFQIIVKGILSVLVPMDYSLLKVELRDFNFFVILYVVLLIIFVSYFIYKFTSDGNIKSIVFLVIIFLVSISPYIYAGYLRPQLILLPFSVLIITVMYVLDSREPILKYFLIFIMVFWTAIGYGTVSSWRTAYSKGREGLQTVLKADFDKNKKNIIIGNPCRLQQSFMYDNVMFPYNYFKYHDFVLNDTIYDIIRTVALDVNSLDSSLEIIQSGNNECIISCKGKTQFFFLDFDEKALKKGNGFRNEYINVEILDYNNFGKPVKLKLNLFDTTSDYYFFKGGNLLKLK